MGANNIKEENPRQDFVGAFFECLGTRKETGDIRKIRSSTLRPTGRFEAGTSNGMRWSKRAHSDAPRTGVAADQVSTLEDGTRTKTPQKTPPVGIYSNGGDLEGCTATSPTRSILRSQDHPLHPPLREGQSKDCRYSRISLKDEVHVPITAASGKKKMHFTAWEKEIRNRIRDACVSANGIAKFSVWDSIVEHHGYVLAVL